ncbi:MAG: DUF58 domain-containing protein [Opitutaceae bacterium]|nr:DUF58 domain-containing protein [Opitutaceae bacterium]
MPPEARFDTPAWHGPGARSRRRQAFRWSALVWSLVFPPRQHRIAPTVSGLFLIALALGIGTAAYNTASNILFLTLALLLACLLLSGLLSWFNFMGVRWRVRAQAPWRAGHEALVTVETVNGKKWLPTYGLWFDLETRTANRVGPDDDQVSVREALAAVDKATTRVRLFLRERMEPAGGESRLEWVVRPSQRGVERVELTSVGSFFPFGFLGKNLGANVCQQVLVWPAQVEYQCWLGTVAAGRAQGERVPRAGAGDDLMALRRYRTSDSHRLIHWKASARLQKLMVRQFSAEAHESFWLKLETSAAVWTRPGQFELLCSLAATMAEDLFAAGKLRGVKVNAQPSVTIRQVRDVEAFLDELARLEPVDDGGRTPPSAISDSGVAPLPSRNIITFAPEGACGVAAYVDGVKTAAA